MRRSEPATYTSLARQAQATSQTSQAQKRFSFTAGGKASLAESPTAAGATQCAAVSPSVACSAAALAARRRLTGERDFVEYDAENHQLQ